MVKDFEIIKKVVQKELGVNYEVAEYEEKENEGNNKYYKKLSIAKKNSKFATYISLDLDVYVPYKRGGGNYVFPKNSLVRYGENTTDKLAKYYLPNFEKLSEEQKKIVTAISDVLAKQVLE